MLPPVAVDVAEAFGRLSGSVLIAADSSAAVSGQRGYFERLI
jgi:hypothetical protein